MHVPTLPRFAGPRRPGIDAPSKIRVLANVLLFELAWFACILGAAHGHPAWGTLPVVAVVAWHVAISEHPLTECVLAALLCAIGLVVESIIAGLGHVQYPSGQPVRWLAPYWIVALWGELAIALNVTLRWLKGRPLLAAMLGALLGPLSFIGGVRLGGAQFVDRSAALGVLALQWGLAMPLVMALSNRFDGVAKARDHA